MCLAVPGRIETITVEGPVVRTGKVNFSGVVREVSLAYVPEANIGDYVLVHVGFAISVIDEDEANQVFQYLREISELEEIDEQQQAVPND